MCWSCPWLHRPWCASLPASSIMTLWLPANPTWRHPLTPPGGISSGGGFPRLDNPLSSPVSANCGLCRGTTALRNSSGAWPWTGSPSRRWPARALLGGSTAGDVRGGGCRAPLRGCGSCCSAEKRAAGAQTLKHTPVDHILNVLFLLVRQGLLPG